MLDDVEVDEELYSLLDYVNYFEDNMMILRTKINHTLGSILCIVC